LNARPVAASSHAASALSALAFFFLMTSYYIMRPVRDQLSGAVGSQSLPLFYLAVFVVMLALTPVFGVLVARFRRKQLLAWSYCFFIACLLAFVPAFVAQDQIGARALGVVFYVWVSIFNLFVVSLFWSFMADIFNGEQARSVFPLIALGGMAGAIFGPLLTKALVQTLGVAPLLAVSAFMLALALGVLLFLSEAQERAGDSQGEPVGGSFWAGARELLTRPFLRYMAILMLLGDGIGTLAYALLADYSKAHFTDKVARTAFYNDLDLYANILGVVLQLTVTRWLMMRRSPIAALVVTASVNLLLLVAIVAWGPGAMPGVSLGLPLLAVLMIGTRGFTYGMTKPASDALYTRVPRETRYKGKNFIETAVWRLGDVLVTSGVSLFGTLGVGVASMAGFGVGVSALSAWVARQIGRAPDLAPETAARPPVARRA
jgi:AAA family ATP:ADP antiporter